MKEKPSLLKPITTHEVPSKISTGSGNMENLVTLNRLLISPFRNNAQAASVCAALAIIEAAEVGEVIRPSSFERDGENKFNWSDPGGRPTADSIGFAINFLLGEEITGEEDEARRDSFSALVQEVLIPRGVEILESMRYDELCDWLIRVLESYE